MLCRRLDYDGMPGHTYNFTVIATDSGSPIALSGTANVRVSVTNVNDEAPVFTKPIEHVQVSIQSNSSKALTQYTRSV